MLSRNLVHSSVRRACVRWGYAAPVRDIKFVLNDVCQMQKHYKKLEERGIEVADEDTVNTIVEAGSTFVEQKLNPLNEEGDRIGCKFENGNVITPPGFKDAYLEFAANGWTGLSVPSEYGGSSLPYSLNIVLSEMNGSSNWSWCMYPGLSLGCCNTLLLHGSEEIKQTYLPKLAEGTWTGTMCLTEAHCGSDLSQVKTKAEPQGDGTFKITGQKIFISCGEHDMSENIVHIVLARLPGAPEGTKGISLFVVPKFLPKVNGSVETGARNGVSCVSIEKKMGIHGSSTCVMAFDNATGWLVGTPNRGLNHMFTFINTSRLGCAMQGVAATEISYQHALAYATERRAMRALSGTVDADKPADRIIVHPDVRRMLLTMKVIAEGGRAMIYHCAKLGDILMKAKSEKEMKDIDSQLAFLTPILKGFLTEMGITTTNMGIQCFGGHGYIRDNKMEQFNRDARIATIYEGTTGIQAIDLLGRKIMLNGTKPLHQYCYSVYKEVSGMLKKSKNSRKLLGFALPLLRTLFDWQMLTIRIAIRASRNKNAVGTASVPYLMYSGYSTMGVFWLRMADIAINKLASKDLSASDRAFYENKLKSATFFFGNLLPEKEGHKRIMLAPVNNIMGVKEEEFAINFAK